MTKTAFYTMIACVFNFIMGVVIASLLSLDYYPVLAYVVAIWAVLITILLFVAMAMLTKKTKQIEEYKDKPGAQIGYREGVSDCIDAVIRVADVDFADKIIEDMKNEIKSKLDESNNFKRF